MKEAVQRRLLALNRAFYAAVADPFDDTRQGWTPGLQSIVAYFQTETKQTLSVLDLGCGNGRLARLLDENEIVCNYLGLDGNSRLLAHAREATRSLSHVQADFVQADLADLHWPATIPDRQFDVVVCLATIQHLPGFELRLRLLRRLGQLASQTIILSFWQFLTSPRFVARQLDWSAIGLRSEDVEAGDALLPWKQGVTAIRYVHQVDGEELMRLAAEAHLHLVDTFRADGREGNLNLYSILEPVRDASP